MTYECEDAPRVAFPFFRARLVFLFQRIEVGLPERCLGIDLTGPFVLDVLVG